MLEKSKFVLDNLRQEDLQELEILWGLGWKDIILKSLKGKKVLFAFGKDDKDNIVPIAMGGFQQVFKDNPEVACVWLLTTKYVYKNKQALLRVVRAHILASKKKYKILYNYIYKSNKEAKKWLLKLGFCFDNPQPKGLVLKKDFEFFYKINERKEI